MKSKLHRDLRALLARESEAGELLRRDRLEANTIIAGICRQRDEAQEKSEQLREELLVEKARGQRLETELKVALRNGRMYRRRRKK